MIEEQETPYTKDTDIKYIKEMPTRLKNCLIDFGVHTLLEASEYTSVDFLKLPNFGARCLEDLTKLLHPVGLSLKDNIADSLSAEVKRQVKQQHELRDYAAISLISAEISRHNTLTYKNWDKSNAFELVRWGYMLADVIIKVRYEENS